MLNPIVDAAPFSAPSADTGLDALIDRRNAAVFLDFDGTLVDLAETPDGIDVPHDLLTLLNALRDAFDGRVAIITGRTDDDVRAYLSGFEGAIYGSHGGSLHLDGVREDLAVPPPTLAALTHDARTFTDGHSDITLEEKSMGFALHYRRNPALEGDVRRYAESVVAGTSALEVQQSKMAFEIKAAGADKGRALRDAVRRFGWESCVPWMFGDDTTDEVAFGVAQAMGGYGVKVGEGDTTAGYRLQNPQQVRALAARLGRMT